MTHAIVDTEETLSTDELEQELEDIYEELEETTGALNATEEQLALAKARVEALEEEREVEGWNEWAKMASTFVTQDEVKQFRAQAHVTEDALVAVYRKGLVTGISYVTDLINKHIEDGMKMYEGSDE